MSSEANNNTQQLQAQATAAHPQKELKYKRTSLNQPQPGVFVLTMHKTSVDLALITEMNLRLDKVDAFKGTVALITTSSNSKIYNSGFDFQVFNLEVSESVHIFREFGKLMARIISCGYPTIAALNGHCFAAGLMLALSHDFRVMRDDYGVICLPEIDLSSSFTPSMITNFKAKLDDHVLKRLAVFGEKFSPSQALEAKIIDRVVKPECLVEFSLQLGKKLMVKSKFRSNMKDIKSMLYSGPIEDHLFKYQGNMHAYGFFLKHKDEAILALMKQNMEEKMRAKEAKEAKTRAKL